KATPATAANGSRSAGASADKKAKLRHAADAATAPATTAFPHVEEMRISFRNLLLTLNVSPAAPNSAEARSRAASRRLSLERINAVSAQWVVLARRPRDCDRGAVLVRQHALEAYNPTAYSGAPELYAEMLAKEQLSASLGATFAWFANHFRWVVWKLAATELAFPLLLFDKYLTAEQVMFQVHRRFATDLCAVRRSILKKVLHRDASPVSCMVLCVAAVLPFPLDQEKHVDLTLPEHWNLGLVLTDGWYSVYAVADLALGGALWRAHRQQGLIGAKLVVWNAQLQNAPEGVDPLECAVASAPWTHPLLEKAELSRFPYLKLPFNSTRRAAFATPLGLEQLYVTADERASLGFRLLKSVPMRSLEVGSGLVRAVRVLVLRVSPVLHLQPKDHTLGPRILCDEHLELYHEARAEHLRLRSRAGATAASSSHASDGDDDSAFERYDRLALLDAPLPTPFVKFDVLCTHELPAIEARRRPTCFGVLTMWRPSPDLLAGSLREGREYFASNLTVNWKLDSGARGVFLRLSTTKSSRFEPDDSSERAGDDDSETGRRARLAQLVGATQRRVCVSIGDAIATHRQAVDDGTVSSERKMVADVCVYVLLVSEAAPLADASTKKKNDTHESTGGVTSAVVVEQQSFVEYAFVTDASARLMSIRLSSTSVSMRAASPPLPPPPPPQSKRSGQPPTRPTAFVFRRGSRNVWRPGAVVCVAGVEISHFDEQLGVLDGSLVESSQVATFPSKRSHLYEPFRALQAQSCADDAAGGGFRALTAQLTQHVERRILCTEFVPSPLDDDDSGDAEAERLTQDFTAHELCVATDAKQLPPAAAPLSVAWDAAVVRLMAMPESASGFPPEVIALAVLALAARPDETAPTPPHARLKTVYFTRAPVVALLSLVRAVVGNNDNDTDTVDNAPVEQLSDADVVDSARRSLEAAAESCCFRVEARRRTNERLLNSRFDWERLHATYLSVERVSLKT
ncbi:hypothetical protein PybrP1_002847, partial [[Pythium] brassicae (nom. inval.)]